MLSCSIIGVAQNQSCRSKSKILRKTKDNLIQFEILVYLNHVLSHPILVALGFGLKAHIHPAPCDSKNVLNSQSFQDLAYDFLYLILVRSKLLNPTEYLH